MRRQCLGEHGRQVSIASGAKLRVMQIGPGKGPEREREAAIGTNSPAGRFRTVEADWGESMSNAIRTIVQGWIHLAIRLLGSTLFLSGSILSVPAPEQLRPTPLSIFICSSVLLLIGALGQLFVSLFED